MAKRYNKYAGLNISSYKISLAPLNLYNTPPEVTKISQTMGIELRQNKAGTDQKLINLIAQYPEAPQFKNYLYNYYLINDQEEEANAILKDTLEKHPNYLFAKINQANLYVQEGKFAEADALMGGEPLDIQILNPERKEFHITEFTTFETYAFEYYIAQDELDKAEKVIDKLKKFKHLDDDVRFLIERLTNRLIFAPLQQSLKRHQEIYEKSPKVISQTKQFFEPSEEPPIFNHPEVENLYYHGFDIPQELLSKILALPRPTLIEDMETMLADFQRRNNYYVEQMESDDTEYNWKFIAHPIFILAELRAYDSLQAVLNVLRQDEGFSNFWFDAYFDDLVIPLYHLGQNQLSALVIYLKEPYNYTWCRFYVSQVLTQVALHQPERRTEVVEYFKDILTYFLENRTQEGIIDGEFLGSMIGHLIDFDAKELLPIIEQLFANELVNVTMSGDWLEIQRNFEAADLPVKLLPLRADIFALYENILHPKPIHYIDEEKAALFQQKNSYLFDTLDKDEDDDFESNPFNLLSKKALKRNNTKYERNDRVSVRYTDGRVEKDVKFKKIEDDWENYLCEIIQ
jgi:hypothetical protein